MLQLLAAEALSASLSQDYQLKGPQPSTALSDPFSPFLVQVTLH